MFTPRSPEPFLIKLNHLIGEEGLSFRGLKRNVDPTGSKRALAALGAGIALLAVQACSQQAPAPTAAADGLSVEAGAVGEAEMVGELPVDPGAPPVPPAAPGAKAAATSGFAPGESLSFEWSANGYEQLPAQYQWAGTGRRDDIYQPNFSLSQPQTDDIIWSSACHGNGQVKTSLYLARPEGMTGPVAPLKFESDRSTRTLSYQARYVAGGQFEGYELIQNVNDPMFAEMRRGSWAYLQLGEGAKATKLRISLNRANAALGAFLPACSGRTQATRQASVAPPAPATPRETTPARAVRATYVCEQGSYVIALYSGNDTASPSVNLDIDGENRDLQSAVSGSGARYETDNGIAAGKSLTWLTQRDQGLLVQADLGDTSGASETVIRCEENKP